MRFLQLAFFGFLVPVVTITVVVAAINHGYWLASGAIAVAALLLVVSVHSYYPRRRRPHK